MKEPLIELIVQAVKKHTCRHCNGDGYTAEHDPNDPHENGCSNCPIQVQCEDCHGEGNYITLDSLRTALASIPEMPNR